MVFRRFLGRSPEPGRILTDEELTRDGDDLGTDVVPSTRRSTVRYRGDERLMEGVYYEIGRRVGHYALENTTAPLCGDLPGVLLYRRLDAWFVTPESERCPTCAGLVGERGERRHGWTTNPGAGDHDIWQRSRAEWDRQWLLRRKHHGPHVEPPPFDENGTFEDPPFVVIEDPQIFRLRHGIDNLVRNDVYAHAPKGKKWHRVYDASLPIPGLESYGRGFAYPCGAANHEFEPVDGWYFEPIRLMVGIPPVEETCKACMQSDAKYGKGMIMQRTRWDH